MKAKVTVYSHKEISETIGRLKVLIGKMEEKEYNKLWNRVKRRLRGDDADTFWGISTRPGTNR